MKKTFNTPEKIVLIELFKEINYDEEHDKYFEIELINDGSTDNSLKILREYEKEYEFIKVLVQENSWTWKARNYGINEVKGEYIAFLDADDIFTDDALEKYIINCKFKWGIPIGDIPKLLKKCRMVSKLEEEYYPMNDEKKFWTIQ